MASQRTIDSFTASIPRVDVDGLSSVPGSSEVEVLTELQETDDFGSTLIHNLEGTRLPQRHYKGVDWNRVPAGYGPCPDGLGTSTSFIWRHGWRVQERNKARSYHFLCHICFRQKGTHTKLIKCATGTGGVKDHLKRSHGITEDGRTTKKRLFSSPGQSNVSAASSDLSASMPPPEKLTYGNAINDYYIHFDPSEFKALLLDYIVSENQAFNTLESSRLQRIFAYLNPAVARRGCLPGHQTMANWIEAAYEANVGLIKEFLDNALSNINLSFDLWTSRKMVAFCGITAHFCDARGKYRSFLLALPQHAGSHAGSNIAETISEIITTFSLEKKLGYFQCDNATNNDTCIQALADQFQFEYRERRLRCIGHIINLVARALLFGNDPDALEHDLTISADDIRIWRNKGPCGRFHNQNTYIRASPQRRERFRRHQINHPLWDDATGDERPNGHELIADNNTRWNAFYHSLERGIEQRASFVDFMEEEASKWDTFVAKWKRDHPSQHELPPSELAKRPAILDDWLSSEDWQVLVDYKNMLQPLEEATMILQGHGAGAAWGVIWQTIPVMEGLLKHFERLKDDYRHAPRDHLEPSQLPFSQANARPKETLDLNLDASCPTSARAIKSKANKAGNMRATTLPESVSASQPDQSEYYQTLCVQVNEGWKKLDHYYELTDRSTVYVTALILHPAFTWEYLESIWRSKGHWIAHHKRKIKQLWQQGYAATPIPVRDETVPCNRRHQSKLFDLEEDCVEELSKDDYTRWCRRPRDRSLIDRPPLEFWTSNAISTSYPRLQRLALNVFTIPAMSDEPERVFSSCGCMIAPHRSRLSAKNVCCCQCLKSWSREGLVNFQIFDHMNKRLMALDGTHVSDEVDV